MSNINKVFSEIFCRLIELTNTVSNREPDYEFVKKLQIFYNTIILDDASVEEYNFIDNLVKSFTKNSSELCSDVDNINNSSEDIYTESSKSINAESDIKVIKDFYEMIFNDWDNPHMDYIKKPDLNCKLAFRIMKYPEKYQIQIIKLCVFRYMLSEYIMYYT